MSDVGCQILKLKFHKRFRWVETLRYAQGDNALAVILSVAKNPCRHF